MNQAMTPGYRDADATVVPWLFERIGVFGVLGSGFPGFAQRFLLGFCSGFIEFL